MKSRPLAAFSPVTNGSSSPEPSLRVASVPPWLALPTVSSEAIASPAVNGPLIL